METEQLVGKAVQVISTFNQAECSAVSEVAKVCFRKSLDTTGDLALGVFACPPINARLLRSNSPEEYVLTTPTGTSFEKGGKDQRINKMFVALRGVGIEVGLMVIIGDTDEADYIFPILPDLNRTDSSLIEARRELFRVNFTDYLRSKFPWRISVERYSTIASLFDEPLPLPSLENPQTKQDLKEETEQMRYFFQPGQYYDGIATPTVEEARQMARLKFKSYAHQGYCLKELFQNMVLIQNEFPLLLRTRMLNLLNKQLGRDLLEAIYPIADRRGKKNG